MDYYSLRLRNKQVLVEHAFKIFNPCFDNPQQQKEQWVERLLDGYAVGEFFNLLKESHKKKEIPIDFNKYNSIGAVWIVEENLFFIEGVKRKVTVFLENSSSFTFQTTTEEPVFVTYHWYRDNGEIYEYDGVRTALPEPVLPGKSVAFEVNIHPPNEVGDFQLMITMVHEGRCWMEEQGLETWKFRCLVNEYDGSSLTRHARSIFERLLVA
jgi:hypothetical protein